MEHWAISSSMKSRERLLHIPRMHWMSYYPDLARLPSGLPVLEIRNAPEPEEIRTDWVLHLPFRAGDMRKMIGDPLWLGYAPVRALYDQWVAAGAPVVFTDGRYGRIIDRLMLELRPAPEGCRCDRCGGGLLRVPRASAMYVHGLIP